MVLLISLAILSYLHGFNLEPSLIRRPFGVQFGILPIEEQNKEPRMSSRVKLSFQRTYFLNFNSFNDLSGEFRLLEGKKKVLSEGFCLERSLIWSPFVVGFCKHFLWTDKPKSQ